MQGNVKLTGLISSLFGQKEFQNISHRYWTHLPITRFNLHFSKFSDILSMLRKSTLLPIYDISIIIVVVILSIWAPTHK